MPRTEFKKGLFRLQQPNPENDSIHARCFLELFPDKIYNFDPEELLTNRKSPPIPKRVRRISNHVSKILREELPDYNIPQEYLELFLTHPDGVTVLLKDPALKHPLKPLKDTVGFTIAVPALFAYSLESYYCNRITSEDTAYIVYTAIDNQHKGHNLVGKMLKRQEEELKRNGFRFIERDIDATNISYVNDTIKNNKGRIVKEETLNSPRGSQKFFRIRI